MREMIVSHLIGRVWVTVMFLNHIVRVGKVTLTYGLFSWRQTGQPMDILVISPIRMHVRIDRCTLGERNNAANHQPD